MRFDCLHHDCVVLPNTFHRRLLDWHAYMRDLQPDTSSRPLKRGPVASLPSTLHYTDQGDLEHYEAENMRIRAVCAVGCVFCFRS